MILLGCRLPLGSLSNRWLWQVLGAIFVMVNFLAEIAGFLAVLLTPVVDGTFHLVRLRKFGGRRE
jgi:hypothetical protein